MNFWRNKLDRAHQRNLNRNGWYRRWHDTPYHRQVHYAVAHLVGWPLLATIFTSLIATLTLLHLLYTTPFAQAAGRTWTSQVDFQSWTKTDTVATSEGAVRLASSATTPGSVTTISAGSVGPYNVIAAPNGMIYATTTGSYSKTLKIDPATGSIVNSITLSNESRAIATGSDGYIYVAGFNSLVKINPATDAVVATYVIDDDDWAIQAMVLAPNGDLYVSTTMNNVYRFDTDTGTVLTTIPCGPYSIGMAVAPNGMLYVTSANNNNMTVIDTNTDTVVTTTAATYSNPQGVTVGQDGYIYIANRDADNVLKIDPNTYATTATIAVGQDPLFMLTDSEGIIWVSNLLGSSVSRIDPATNSVLSTITVGTNPRGIGQGLDGKIYVVGGTMATSFISWLNPGYSFSLSGTATTTFTPAAGQTNTWNSAVVTKNEPSGTSVVVSYSNDNATWKTDLATVPASTSLYVKADFTSSSATTTPVLSSLAVDYDPVVGGGDPPVSNSDTNSTVTNTTTTPVTTTQSNTTDQTISDETGNAEPVVEDAAAVAKPENVQVYAGTGGMLLTFKAPPAGHRMMIWRSTDPYTDGLKVESTDQDRFMDYQALPYPTVDTYYYRVEMYRVSDMKYSEPVRVSAKYPLSYYYGVQIGTRNVTLKVGETQQLTATVIDGQGNQVNLPVTWSVVNSRLGTITPEGLFTAGQNAGFWSEGIKATVADGALGGEATVSVGIDPVGPVVAQVALNPESITLEPGQTQSFQVVLIDQYGAKQVVSDQANTVWRSSVGTMSGNTLTAGATSTLSSEGVTATYTDADGQTWVANSRVAVSTEKPYLYRVFMTGTQRLATGATFRYNSWGYDQFNNYLNRNVTRNYQSTDTNVAVIDPAGTVHVGEQVGCFYWMLRADQTYDGRTGYGLSGVVTQPLTEAQTAKVDATRVVAWRQIKYVYQPGEVYQLSAYVYTGWGYQAPGEYVEYEMADPAAGAITKNGLFTATTNNGTYKTAINLTFVNTQTGERRSGPVMSITVAKEASTLAGIKTTDITTRSNWHWATSAALTDQFGYPYRGAFTYRWSLLSGNSAILPNGIVNTGAAESTKQTINLDVTTADGQTMSSATRGSITTTDDYSSARYCSTTGAIVTDGQFVGPDGELLYYDSTELSSALATALDQSMPATSTEEVDQVQRTLIPLTAVAIIAALPGLLSGVAQVLGQAFSRLASGFTSLLQIIGLSHRNAAYGLVTNRRRRAVKGARVDLLAPTDRSVVESQVTDAEGRYAFRQNPGGTYLLRVTAAGYETAELRVRGAMIHRHIRLGQSLEGDERRLKRLRRWGAWSRFLIWFCLAILIVGTVSWFLVIQNGQWSLLVGLMGWYYALAWLLEWLMLASPHPYGMVKDGLSGVPVPLVAVRISDQSGRVVATEVTDQLGRYRSLLSPGRYSFSFSKLGYRTVERRQVLVTRASAAVQIKLDRVS